MHQLYNWCIDPKDDESCLIINDSNNNDEWFTFLDTLEKHGISAYALPRILTSFHYYCKTIGVKFDRVKEVLDNYESLKQEMRSNESIEDVPEIGTSNQEVDSLDETTKNTITTTIKSPPQIKRNLEQCKPESSKNGKISLQKSKSFLK